MIAICSLSMAIYSVVIRLPVMTITSFRGAPVERGLSARCTGRPLLRSGTAVYPLVCE